MNSVIKISVVIPVYNSASTIEETLDSIVAQSYNQWEAICVDDGSTDNSLEIINNYIEKHSGKQILVVKREKKEKGGSVCRNIGASLAKGDYLIFLDADDLLTPFCLERRITAIEGTENKFVVYPMAAFANDDLSTAQTYSRLFVKEPIYMFLSGFGTWQVTSSMIRKDYFDSLGGFDDSFPRFQDVEFHIRAILESNNKYEVLRDSTPDCLYRQSNCTSVKVEKLKRTIKGCNKLISLIEEYVKKGVILNKKKLSISIMSLYCHLSLYQDWVIEQETDYVRINPIRNSELWEHISIKGHFMVGFIELVKGTRFRILICRIMDKFLRTKLAR